MRVFGNDITVQRGEDFTVDFNLVNKDGSPYVVNKDLANPNILISVVSNSYNTDNVYMLNQWCSLREYFLFESLQPVLLADPSSAPADIGDTGVISTTTAGISYYNKNIFYTEDSSGKHYKYYNVTDSTYSDYEFRIIVSFSTEITKEWTSQVYTYSICLVSGDQLVNMDQSDSDFEDVIETRIPILPEAKITVLNSIGG